MYELPINIAVITMSDRASRGIYEDKSGPLASQMFTQFLSNKGKHVQIKSVILPDSEEQLKETMLLLLKQVDIICITGGTGIAPRDITPDVVKPMLTKEIPGIMEMIRVKYGMQFPNTLISRALAGVIKNVLVYAIPGSPKAVKEYLTEILPTIIHSLKMLKGEGH